LQLVPKHIAIIQGHPEPRGHHYCHALGEAYVAGAREAGHEVEIIDVARLEFSLLRSRVELERGAVPETIKQSQEVLTRSGHVVLIYPVWNGGTPALLKGFLEQTFRSAFIFPDAKPGERQGFSSYFPQRKALTGRSHWTARASWSNGQ
jgi:putative NADPH-quinone reductase